MNGGSVSRRTSARRRLGAFGALVGVAAGLFTVPTTSSAAPVQAGFDITVDDLRFILKQIRIAETHATREGVGLGAVVAPTTPLGAGPNDIPDPLLPWGLRQVDGRNNNLMTGWSQWTGKDYASTGGGSALGAADQPFLRETDPLWRATDPPTGLPSSMPRAETYNPTARPSSLQDADPRVISNLISDQSPNNPAAVATAGVGATPGVDGSLIIPNVAPNAGVAAPYNGMFALFGQFFDHGLDLVGKTSSEIVLIPLQADDPLYVTGSPTNFMALNRTVLDANGNGNNSTTPWIDQNQTYTSHPSHQVFLRQYALNGAGKPVTTGKLADGAIAGNIASWAEVKTQAATLLGIQLVDTDIFNVPLVLTDEYGRFLRGPNGYPQLVQLDGTVVEGNPTTPISTTNAARTGHAFLDDIAHAAVPNGTPDADTTLGNTPGQGFYDDELLNAHFITGDGRGNENIGLTAIHTFMHAEHNRLVDQIKSVVTANAGSFATTDWFVSTGVWNGERLFQASRFVMEMEYQHLVFEQFARKVQPGVAPFVAYDPTVNPSVTAEFAHAVYRYGHSQLNPTIDRTLADGSDASLPLLTAFLSPQKFNDNGSGGTLTAAEAAGAIVRGMTKQVGNEIDEFMTGTLRNTLVGLPLDLAALNMTRARDNGMGSLNSTRRSFFTQTGDPALAPYSSWLDFSFSMRHPASLVNFIAAYGTHPTITAATTVAAKRAAAQLIVNLDASVTDAGAFMSGTGSWADVANRPVTGVEDIDLWVGGLAEARTPFAGMLGSTFNHVFQKQMESLQDGDRFYYLGRLAGLNLLTQIEPNFLSEIVLRNTDLTALPADPFAYPTYIFDMSQAAPAQITTLADGTWRYPGSSHVVFSGTAGANRAWSGLGDDTLRGNDGNDWLQGNQGLDVIIGGAGNDVILDSSGVDNLIGGPGNDYLASGGPGLDALQGNDGIDVIVAGSDGIVGTGGLGVDYLYGGGGADSLGGDDGSDWVEGGGGADALTGDIIAPFGIDVTGFGDDVLLGGAGANLFTGGGGLDIMLPGPTAGNVMVGDFGFDWVTYYDPSPATARAANADLNLLVPVPGTPGLVDTFDLVEAASGGDKNDVLRGDLRTALTTPGTTLTDNLTSTDSNKITNLRLLLPTGVTSWTAGNILIGGRGSDVLDGRDGNDLLDGDAWLETWLSVPAGMGVTGQIDPASGRVLVPTMATVKDAVLAGTLDPAGISIVRVIRTEGYAGETDQAVFTGPLADYTITYRANGWITVADNVNLGGTDWVRNVEQLVFFDQSINVDQPSAVTAVAPSATTTSVTLSWSPPVRSGASPVNAYTARLYTTATGNNVAANGNASCVVTTTTCTITGLSNGVTYYAAVVARNGTPREGSPGPAVRYPVRTGTPPAAPTAPGATVLPGGVLNVTWSAPTTGSAPTGYTAKAYDATTGGNVVASCSTNGALTCSLPAVPVGTTYYVDVQASNISGFGPATSPRVSVTPATAPGAPRLVSAYRANTAAVVVFSAPLTTGGSPITGYTARAFSTVDGTVPVSTCSPASMSATDEMRCTITGLTNGTSYSFDAVATNSVGTGAGSLPRPSVNPATVPDAPATPTPTPASTSIALSWSAPTNPGGALTGYVAQAFATANGLTAAGQCTATPPATTCTISGLTASTNYWVSVRAANSSGTGAPSVRAATTTTAAPPPPPVVTTYPNVVNVIAGKTSLLPGWTPPTSNPGTVTSYIARVFSTQTSTTVLASCTAVSTTDNCQITGRNTNTTYWVEVAAVRTGVESKAPRVQVRTLAGNVPGPPTIASVTPGPARMAVNWTAPGNTGGSVITGYQVRAYSSAISPTVLGTCTSTTLTCTVLTGLAPGTTYWFDVAAVNINGTGTPSARVSGTTG